jgi:hypothetical protein
MRKYSSNLAFVDLLFNLLVGFTSLFIIAFLMINPVSQTGQTTPPVKMFVEIEWDSELTQDIDLFVRGPNGNVVYYANKDGGYVVLQRDDLGSANDTYILNGERIVIKRNYEIANFSDLPAGEYVIGVFYFSRLGDPIDVKTTVRSISPHRLVYEGTAQALTPRTERTLLSFVIDKDGKVTDLNTEVQIPITGRRKLGGL